MDLILRGLAEIVPAEHMLCMARTGIVMVPLAGYPNLIVVLVFLKIMMAENIVGSVENQRLKKYVGLHGTIFARIKTAIGLIAKGIKMRKLICLFALLTSVACGNHLLEPGTYDVAVTYEVDKGQFSSMAGETDNQEWEITEETIQFFRGSKEYDYTIDNKCIIVETENFYMELFPKEDGERFDGDWTNMIPDLMLTIATVKGKKQ